MAVISESIPDLLGGISQLAPQRRTQNEVEDMLNCLPRMAEGVINRPPTQWIAEIAADATPYSGALVHPINKSSTERFWVVVLDGDLAVIDASTGTAVPVVFQNGKTYLDVTGQPNESFRVATFNDTTVIVNREKVVAKGNKKSSSRGKEEALIVVNTGEFASEYGVYLNFDGNSGVPSSLTGLVSYTTPQADPANQVDINTSYIAEELKTRLEAAYGNLLSIDRYGSTLHIQRGAGLPSGMTFWCRHVDGLASEAMTTIQGSVQSVDVLPPEAPIGFKIKVEGNPIKDLDDVYYIFGLPVDYTGTTSFVSEGLAWRETVEDGIIVDLNPDTLPLELVKEGTLLEYPMVIPAALQQSEFFTRYYANLKQTKDGTDSTAAEAIVTPSPGTSVDRFLNLADANTSTVKSDVRFTMDTRRVIPPGVDPKDPSGAYYDGDLYDIEIALDTGGGFTTIWSERIAASNNYVNRKSISLDEAAVPAGSDLRLRVTSAAGNAGSLTVTWELEQEYRAAEGLNILIPSVGYAPNTAMSFTLNGTAFSDTYTTGGTQADYGTRLKTQIEAYGGTPAVTVSIGSGHITIANNDGTMPTLTAFAFDPNIDPTTEFFNPEKDFVAYGIQNGDTLSNENDGSIGTITSVTTHLLTCSAGFTGGTNNEFANGDSGKTDRTTLAFICREPDWAERQVGTEKTNKWPSFVDNTINEVAFLKNRLLFLSNENVIMSEVDEFFNFFRSSTLDVLDSDRIDVALSGNKASQLHSAFTWNETLLVWSELSQFVVNGEPFLSPNTVRRETTTSYVNTRKVRPVASERSVYFLTEGNDFAQLWRYTPLSDDASSAEATRVSLAVPRLIAGTPRGLLAVSDPEIVLMHGADDPDTLYVLSYLTSGEDNILLAWHRWQFPGVVDILGIGSIDNEVSLILERDDGAVHLEVLDLWQLTGNNVDGQTNTTNHPVPPTFSPAGTFLRTSDSFTEAADAKLSAHTPPTSPSGAGWLVNAAQDVIGAGGIYVDGTLDVLRADDAQASNVPPVRINWSDSYLAGGGTELEMFADISFSSNQSNRAELRAYCKAGSGDTESGLRLIVRDVSATQVTIELDASDSSGDTEGTFYPTDDAAGGLITVAANRTHGGGTLTNQVRYGFRVVGDTITVYTADAVTGANEVTLYTGTLRSAWKTQYRTSSYTYHGAKVTATVFHTARLDNFTYRSGNSPAQTVITPPLDPSTFTLVGIDPNGDTQVLTDNGDGTASWIGSDVTGQSVIVGIVIPSSIVLSTLFHRKNFGQFATLAETRGDTYIRNLWIGLDGTTAFSVQVDITGHASFTQDLVEPRSLDEEFMHVHVGGRNSETTITFTNVNGVPFKIVGFDWDGIYHSKIRRVS
jgi:hypothetical protein